MARVPLIVCWLRKCLFYHVFFVYVVWNDNVILSNIRLDFEPMKVMLNQRT